MKAEGIYGITRLAACIYDLRKAGYAIKTKHRRDAVGHHFSEYSWANA